MGHPEEGGATRSPTEGPLSPSAVPHVLAEGDLFKIYLLTYAVFRFFVEFVRGNVVVWHGLSGSQLFLIPSTMLLAGYFVRQRWSDSNDRGGAWRIRETGA